MKKHIFFALCLLATDTGLWAQNPIQTTFTVELKTEQGKDTTIQIQSVNSNTFRFIGGEATIKNPVTGETSRQGNQDLLSWIEDLDYNKVTLKTLPSSGISVETVGYCYANHPSPTIEDNLANCYMNGEAYYVKLYELDYMSTYYARPWVRLAGYLMYGGEVEFTTPRTIEAAFLNEPDFSGGYYYDEATGVVLNAQALTTLANGNEQFPLSGVSTSLEYFLTDDMISSLKKQAYTTIECSNGTLFVVKNVPEAMVTQFTEYINEPLSFCPTTYNESFTKNANPIEIKPCDPSWGLPYDSYMDVVSASEYANPSIAFDIPKYLLPQTYALSVVMINPDMENDLRPYKFRTSIYEQTEKGNYSQQEIRNPKDGGRNFISDSLRCDTVNLGTYTFSGRPGTIIQFQSNVSSRETSVYNREMRIAQINIVPIKEEDNE